MKSVKCKTLFDGIEEKSDCYIGFEGNEIKYVGKERTPKMEGTTEKNNEIITEGDTYSITPGFIDAHSHIGLVRSGEPDREEEANERFNLSILWYLTVSIWITLLSLNQLKGVYFIRQFYQVVETLLEEKQF